jgi:hypothetical protein
MNHKFHEGMERSVGSLRGGIEHLEQVLNDFPSTNGGKI